MALNLNNINGHSSSSIIVERHSLAWPNRSPSYKTYSRFSGTSRIIPKTCASTCTYETHGLHLTKHAYTYRPTSNFAERDPSASLPFSVARNLRRKTAWMKAQAQHVRNRRCIQEASDHSSLCNSCNSKQPFDGLGSHGFSPMRKRAAFVKDEELKCMLEDRAGTPHISELKQDEDVVTSLHVVELGLVGAVDVMLAGEVWT
ncbi:hypothetical protein CC86DRAFT_470600 [Ophiobolus disseminans]|uniref:Uncharacterized protein n=1 Tax=Ophiobolus disseminans TaxID=1469910 RepID=A0A6A6ZKF3_9PLEO|nr:hypothetical protein CC86DRAFT_470600 [Ophiobolus disseminans]